MEKIKNIIKEILKNLKKNNLKKFKYGAFGGLIQKEKRIRKLLTKIIEFLENIDSQTRQSLFNDPKLSITRNLKKAYNTAIETNQFITSETTTPNSNTIKLNFLKKDFEQLNKLYKENIAQGNFTNFDTIKNEPTKVKFCEAINTLNNEIKSNILQKVNALANDNIDKKLKTYEFIVSYNNFINNLKEYCTNQTFEELRNNKIKDKLKSIGSSSGVPPPGHDFPKVLKSSLSTVTKGTPLGTANTKKIMKSLATSAKKKKNERNKRINNIKKKGEKYIDSTGKLNEKKIETNKNALKNLRKNYKSLKIYFEEKKNKDKINKILGKLNEIEIKNIATEYVDASGNPNEVKIKKNINKLKKSKINYDGITNKNKIFINKKKTLNQIFEKVNTTT